MMKAKNTELYMKTNMKTDELDEAFHSILEMPDVEPWPEPVEVA